MAAVKSCNSRSAIDLPWVTIMMKPRSMKFMPSVAMSDERPAVTTSAPTHAPSAMPVSERRDNAEKRAQARMHDERENPG